MHVCLIDMMQEVVLLPPGAALSAHAITSQMTTSAALFEHTNMLWHVWAML